MHGGILAEAAGVSKTSLVCVCVIVDCSGNAFETTPGPHQNGVWGLEGHTVRSSGRLVSTEQMSVHPVASGFGEIAAAYERTRPGYAEEAIEFLIDRLQIDATSTVADLGAGTGKLSRLLVPTGARILAVEPQASMRQVLRATVPSAEALDGTAEAIPLQGNGVDVVIAGQAFHWFRGQAALAEIGRVLVPGGLLGLVWNRREPDDPVQAAILTLIDRYQGDTPFHPDGSWRLAFHGTDFDLADSIEVRQIQTLPTEALTDLVNSFSSIAALPADERDAALEEIRALQATLPVEVGLTYVTEVYVYRSS